MSKHKTLNKDEQLDRPYKTGTFKMPIAFLVKAKDRNGIQSELQMLFRHFVATARTIIITFLKYRKNIFPCLLSINY